MDVAAKAINGWMGWDWVWISPGGVKYRAANNHQWYEIMWMFFSVEAKFSSCFAWTGPAGSRVSNYYQWLAPSLTGWWQTCPLIQLRSTKVEACLIYAVLKNWSKSFSFKLEKDVSCSPRAWSGWCRLKRRKHWNLLKPALLYLLLWFWLKSFLFVYNLFTS